MSDETPDKQGGRREANAAERDALLKQLEAIPKGVYVELAGVPRSTIDRHGRSTGLPVMGPTVNLFAVASWIHSQITSNRAAWDEKESALEEGRREDNRIKRIRRRELESELIPRDQLHDMLSRLSRHLRGFGDGLRKRGENDTLAIFDKMLASFKRELKELKTEE